MKKNIFFLFFFCITALAYAQTTFTLTPELLWRLGRVSDPQTSIDGKSVLYNVRYYDVAENKGQSDIYKASTDGKKVVRLTSTPKASETNARWMSDGRIAYLSDVEGDVNFYIMNADGSGSRKVPGIPANIGTFGLSYLGDMLYFTQDVKVNKTTAELYPDLPKATGRIFDGLMMRHWNAWEDESFSHIFIVKFKNGIVIDEPYDIMKNEPYDAPLQPFGGDEQICWSPDGSRIAYTSKKLTGTDAAKSTNSDIYIYNVYNQKTENISQGNGGYDTNPVFSPDGTQIMWLSMEEDGYEADKNNIMVYDYGLLSKTRITEKFDNTVEKAVYSPDGRAIYFNAPIAGTVQLFKAVPGERNTVITQLTDQVQDLSEFSIGQLGKNPVIIAGIMSMSMPTELFSINPSNGKPLRITNTNTDMLAKIKMGKVERRDIKAKDGNSILTWVIYPPDFNPKSKKKYPVLLYCQGGPQSMVSQFFSYRWNFQLMAANGYIIVAPNRRGLPGFGQNWTDQIAGDWGGAAMSDLLAAIDDVSSEPYANKDRMGCVGASYGGYSVYWMAGNHENRFKAFVAHCGVYNMQSMYGATEEMFFVNHDFKGPYWQDNLKAQYDLFSPHRFVQNWNTPILIIHNEKDFRVPLNQGMEAFAAAQMRGVTSRFLYFPDEGHWVTKPQNSILWQRVYFDWLDRYLK